MMCLGGYEINDKSGIATDSFFKVHVIYLVVVEIATYLIIDFGWFNFLNNYLLHIDMNFYNIGGTRYPHLKTCSGISEKRRKFSGFQKVYKKENAISKKKIYSCFYCDAIIKKK